MSHPDVRSIHQHLPSLIPPTALSVVSRRISFIAYALHRTRLTPSVTFAAPYLLQRMDTRVVASGSFGSFCFISSDASSEKGRCGQHKPPLRSLSHVDRVHFSAPDTAEINKNPFLHRKRYYLSGKTLRRWLCINRDSWQTPAIARDERIDV